MEVKSQVAVGSQREKMRFLLLLPLLAIVSAERKNYDGHQVGAQSAQCENIDDNLTICRISTMPLNQSNLAQVLRVGPLDDQSYFVLRDLQMTSK